PHFRDISKRFVKSSQALFRGGFCGKFGLETLRLAGKCTAPNFTQYRLFAGEITEERGLADLQRLYDVVDASVFVAALPKKMQSCLNNLLAKPRLFSLAKTRGLLSGGYV